MESLRDVMDTVADSATDGPVYASLYDDLVPLYAFERERMRDFDAVADFVVRQAPVGARSVGVGACGVGLLLGQLAARFERVVGFDASPRMLALARERTDAPVVAADLRTVVAPSGFDVVTILGGSIAHLPIAGERDSVREALTSAYETLRPGGVFCCDFMERGALESGAVSTDTFESERFSVERTVITTGHPDRSDGLGATGRYTFAYEITDTESGDAVRVGTATTVREFSAPGLLAAALDAGFADASLVRPPTHGMGLVAHKRADADRH